MASEFWNFGTVYNHYNIIQAVGLHVIVDKAFLNGHSHFIKFGYLL